VDEKVDEARNAGKLRHDPLQELRDVQRTLERISDPGGIRKATARIEGARARWFEWFGQQNAIAQRIRERDEAHGAELESAWRGEVPADPMPREMPATLDAWVELERAESRFRTAHFVRFERELNTWARWLSMRETAFASALGAMALAGAKPSKREGATAEYEARVNRARSWTDAKGRAKAIRCALYALLEEHRSHPDDDDAKNIATRWVLEAPELGRRDLLRVVVGVSLARVLEAWRTTAEGKRNRVASVYGVLSVFFRRVAGLDAVHDATIETESREAREGWRKPKRSMPRNGGKKKGKR
jgi:hypothetical protein